MKEKLATELNRIYSFAVQGAYKEQRKTEGVKVSREIAHVETALRRAAKKGNNRVFIENVWFTDETINYFKTENVIIYVNSTGTIFKF